jgi:hypothetical protein
MSCKKPALATMKERLFFLLQRSNFKFDISFCFLREFCFSESPSHRVCLMLGFMRRFSRLKSRRALRIKKPEFPKSQPLSEQYVDMEDMTIKVRKVNKDEKFKRTDEDDELHDVKPKQEGSQDISFETPSGKYLFFTLTHLIVITLNCVKNG